MNKHRILLVDDEPVFTRVMRDYLEDTGRFQVRMVNDPRKVLSAVREFHPHLVVLDVIMPEMDGGEVASQIKEDASTRNTPILFLTAIVSKDDVSPRGERIAGHPFLPKPVDARTLVECVDRQLKEAA